MLIRSFPYPVRRSSQGICIYRASTSESLEFPSSPAPPGIKFPVRCGGAVVSNAFESGRVGFSQEEMEPLMIRRIETNHLRKSNDDESATVSYRGNSNSASQAMVLQHNGIVTMTAARRWGHVRAAVPGACALLLTLIVTSHGDGHEAESRPADLAVDRRTPVVRVFEQSRNAVVNISTTQIVQLRDPLGFDLFEQFFHMPRRRTFRRQSVGSGFVLHEAGYIVTNAHVVARTAERKVLFADERAFDAQVVALDHEHDLAVLKIDADGPLATLPLGTSHDLMVGETVIAIGSPLGLSDTVTAGVISAVDRELEFGDGKSFKGLIQTDASINPGNSGGPLLNILGDLIGVNTAMRGDAQNIGFAIPVDQLYKVLPEMLDVERRYGINVGIHVVAFETPDGQRLKIKSIDPDSPAHKSALRDQLVFIDQVDGRPVRTAIDYHIAMIGKRPGDALTLGVRFGKSPPTIVELRIAQRPRPDATVLLRDKFGIVTMPLTHDAARALRVRTDSGLLVTAVESDSPAHDAGVRRGDLLVRLGRHGAARLDELGELLEKVKPGQPIRVAVIRMSGNTTLQLIGEMRARRVNH
ncbi:MAG: hypothetical protein CMJ21_03005 [Phycisphaerae bacterium]|nr:hypothetical protein [Phycisphaerae bacterium]